MRRPGAGIGRRGPGFRGIGSGAAAPSTPPPVNSVAPAQAWTVSIGSSPSITPGTWSGSPTLTYTLLRDGSPVAGAEDLTEAQAEAYTAVAADVGPSLVWEETATNAGGSDSANSNSVAYSPAQMTNLRGWYRADLGITLSGSDVDAWADQSGAGNHMSAAGASSRPVFVASESRLGTRPAVQGDGNLEWLRNTAFDFGATPGEISIWVAVAYDVFVGFDRVVTYSAAAPMALRLRSSSGNKMGLIGPSGGESISTTDMVDTAGYFFGGTFDDAGDTRSLYNKATQEDSDAETTAGPADDQVLALFASTTGTLTAAVTIAEVIVQRAVTSSSERADLAAYVAYRYGL